MAPDLCLGCGTLGVILCEHCKYDIVHEPFVGCVVCAAPSRSGICDSHNASYSRAWAVADRKGVVLALLDTYKFNRAARADKLLAEMLDVRLPYLPPDTVVLPVPTSRSHVRQRGYDHCLRVAQEFARLRELTFLSPLESHVQKTQHFLNKAERQSQTEHAFSLTTALDPARPHLIIDDIVTTGSTLAAIANIIRSAGVNQVWVAAIARQPLD